MKLIERVIGKRVVYSGNYLSTEQQTVVLPDGRQAIRDIVRPPRRAPRHNRSPGVRGGDRPSPAAPLQTLQILFRRRLFYGLDSAFLSPGARSRPDRPPRRHRVPRGPPDPFRGSVSLGPGKQDRGREEHHRNPLGAAPACTDAVSRSATRCRTPRLVPFHLVRTDGKIVRWPIRMTARHFIVRLIKLERH